MSILKREVYYDQAEGLVRFWDWAHTTTTLGTMVEPFQLNTRHANSTPFSNFDPTDDMSRVDEMHRRRIGEEQIVLGGPHHLHGGAMMPRVGY